MKYGVCLGNRGKEFISVIKSAVITKNLPLSQGLFPILKVQ